MSRAASVALLISLTALACGELADRTPDSSPAAATPDTSMVASTPTSQREPDTMPDSAEAAAIYRLENPDTTRLVSVPGSIAWFDKVSELDVTGDGRPDTLRLKATGVRAESLHITLVAVIDGDTITLERWRGADELGNPGDAPDPGPELDNYMRGRLNRILARADTSLFSDSTLGREWIPRDPGEWDCEMDVHNCIVYEIRQLSNPTVHSYSELGKLPFDTARARAVVADVRDNAKVRLHYSLGYESVTSVVWSPLAHRFFIVFSCC